MAVPFNIPEDQNDVEVLLFQLQTLLNRLKLVVHKNQQQLLPQPSSHHHQQQQQQQQQPSSSSMNSSSGSRVRHSSSNSIIRERSSPDLIISHHHHHQSVESITHQAHGILLPDLLSNLSNATSNYASSLTATSLRIPRRRTTSESSNPDDSKISITAIVKHDCCAQDWNKNNCLEDNNENSTVNSDGLLSKLMPASISSCSFMTAMICFVGWHIFRAR